MAWEDFWKKVNMKLNKRCLLRFSVPRVLLAGYDCMHPIQFAPVPKVSKVSKG